MLAALNEALAACKHTEGRMGSFVWLTCMSVHVDGRIFFPHYGAALIIAAGMWSTLHLYCLPSVRSVSSERRKFEFPLFFFLLLNELIWMRDETSSANSLVFFF